MRFRKFFYCLGACLILILCTSCLKQTENPQFEVTIFKIGAADAMVLETENHTVLIDTGEKEDGEEILEFLNKKQIQKVDYLILTHFDKDHVGGADTLLEAIAIDQIIQPDYVKDGNQYREYMEALDTEKKEPLVITELVEFQLDDVRFTVYPPEKTDYGTDNSNDFSLCIQAIHGENQFWFTGDAMAQRLTELMNYKIGDCDFLKVPHHGRYNEQSQAFLTAAKPKYAAVTCSNKNPPDDEILQILNDIGTKTYLTSNGNITCISDGKQITITQ